MQSHTQKPETHVETMTLISEHARDHGVECLLTQEVHLNSMSRPLFICQLGVILSQQELKSYMKISFKVSDIQQPVVKSSVLINTTI